jgi:hypothetical protein
MTMAKNLPTVTIRYPDMNAETLAALKGSIAKWDAIVAETLSDEGAINCPLCQLFARKGCIGCPVRASSGMAQCSGTPYANWYDGCRREHLGNTYLPWFATTDELKALARAEADFLRSLLPEGETAT